MSVKPIDAARNVLDRAEILLTMDVPPHDDALRQDVRRMVWAMGSTALDTYFHWRVKAAALNAPLPKKLRELRIPFGDLVDSGDYSVASRRADVRDRPQTRARNTLYRVILSESYNSPQGIEKAVSMFGGKSPWGATSAALGVKPSEVRDRVARIATRRNHIVHEGDIKRQSRPRVVQHQELGSGEVRDELAWIRQFLEAVEAEV